MFKLPDQRPLIMGVLNLTPDSFSGDGLLPKEDYINASLHLAEVMIQDGAALLDVGGESSRPGSKPVTADEEMRRVLPVIRAIKQKFTDVLISVDTVKAQVADAAIEAGADIINDISGLQHDAAMPTLVADKQVGVVIMHNRSSPEAAMHDVKIGGVYRAPHYEDIIKEVTLELMNRVKALKACGVKDQQIILDPGLGFGKSVQQNMALITHLDAIKSTGYPVLLGPSRKSFIGHVLDVTVDEREEGTAACVAVATLKGVDVLRVHDVKSMSRVMRMTRALSQV